MSIEAAISFQVYYQQMRVCASPFRGMKKIQRQHFNPYALVGGTVNPVPPEEAHSNDLEFKDVISIGRF